MIQNGIKSGHLKKGKTIIESTSGNTGIALAMIGRALGYPVELVIPSNVSSERKRIVAALGAKQIFSDPLEGSDGALRLCRKILTDDPEKYFKPDQYYNPMNSQAHYETTGIEIWEQTAGKITHFVGGVGTGGTITGAGRRLKEYNPKVQVCCVMPDEFPGIEGLKPLGKPEDIVPEILDESIIDWKIPVTIDQAYDMCNRLGKHGWFVGQSSGGYLQGAYEVAKQIQSGVIVTVFNDLGERYFSTRLWD